MNMLAMSQSWVCLGGWCGTSNESSDAKLELGLAQELVWQATEVMMVSMSVNSADSALSQWSQAWQQAGARFGLGASAVQATENNDSIEGMCISWSASAKPSVDLAHSAAL
jgi:hypothetical protein